MENPVYHTLDYNRHQQSPPVRRKSEYIALNVDECSCKNGSVDFNFYISYFFPESIIRRYERVEYGFVMVGSTGGGATAARTYPHRRFIGAPPAVGLEEPSPPFLSRGSTGPEEKKYTGGYVNGSMGLVRKGPEHPFAFVYTVFENYISKIAVIDSKECSVLFINDSASGSGTNGGNAIALTADRNIVDLKKNDRCTIRGTCRINKDRYAPRKEDLSANLIIVSILGRSHLPYASTMEGLKGKATIDRLDETGTGFMVDFHFDLSEIIPIATAVPISWYIHASCCQHVSNIMKIDIVP